ncbi:UpxY family transcription antiterminator [Gramella sp. MAR_2010_147]|uniref:UpxY family transcription antiterminator n=1 Tax=Gramella sp. MAR_2010_147 TaxID=1250205 RepID=UPI00087B7FBD|nr:UpxY family transcription antiterminator [Gramella sp. MAR_2010_147]SDS17916.1 Transcription antitermination factor NusG [Gramella sp. MAR_2010_147]
MPWYVVVRTKPQHEIKTAQFLEKAGIEVFCPVITEVRQWSDRKRKVTVPLFKSYIFVKIQEKDRNAIFNAPGVLGFLKWLQKPAIAKDDEIEAIRSWLNNDRLGDFQVNQLKEGDEVEIKSGKMTNKKAIVKEVGNKKLKLILNELGWTLTANIQDLV